MATMKRVAKRKPEAEDTGAGSSLRVLFRSFAKLVERAGAGRPLLRGLRVAYDPNGDRVVVVHGGSRIEFVLVLHRDYEPPCAEIECRRMDSAGVSEQTAMARFRFDEAGLIVEASVPELLNEKVDQETGAWSIVAAVIWDAMQQQP
jgi:hypothetical protein